LNPRCDIGHVAVHLPGRIHHRGAGFLTAIAIARQQKGRSFELQAALSLAKLYQSTNRLREVYDVLATALEGFTPTPELPEIAEAKALLDALSSAPTPQ
jgi:hypothetical protein